MASNTEILIKRSFATATPANLAAGELAYSYSSNNLFIGTPDGVSALEIGGYKSFPITPGDYGSTSAIPVIRVSANGLITNVSTAAISSTLNISGDSGTDAINLLTDTLNFAGGDGITSAVTDNVVTFNVDTTVFRSNTYTSTQSVFSDVQISGNLTVLGTQTTINVSNLRVEDSLIQLAANNTGDILDIGFFGHYYDGTQKHTGLFRDANDKQYYLFSGYSIEPTANNIVPFTDDFALATLRANLTANTANVQDRLALSSGSLFYANGTSQFNNGIATFNGGIVSDNTLIIKNGNYIQLKNADESTTIDLYNSGSTGVKRLYANSDIQTSRNLFVANRIYGDTTNNALYLVPSTSYAPEVNDQYIIIDPTAPNRIHLRAGGVIDNSTANLYLGGEITNVVVYDGSEKVTISANTSTWEFDSNNTLYLPGGSRLSSNGYSIDLIAGSGGYSYVGLESSDSNNLIWVDNIGTYIATNWSIDQHIWFFDTTGKLTLPNAAEIYDVPGTLFVNSAQSTFSGNVTANGSATINGNIFVPNLPNGATANLVYYDAANGRFSYSSDNALTPTSIANGAFSLSIQSTDGLLVHNGAGLQLANGAIIKDTSGDAVAFGQNAGTITQGLQAVAIGDSAGYNNQGAYGVAIGYGAGNVNQGQTAVAIGINAGISNQGAYGIAIGNSSGGGQGQYSIALGYDSGGQQGASSIAIGEQAGKGNTTAIGINTIAIGKFAGFESAAANSIILNASGLNLSSATGGFFVNPVRYTATQDATYDGIALYNSNTKEIRYSYVLDGGSF